MPLPDAEVSLYGPGTDSGTFDYFTDTINGEEGLSRKDYQASEDDNVLVQGVEGDETGLGYFGFSYYEQNMDGLNLVSVDGGDGCVAPSAETIQDGSYAPLSRPLFMYPSEEALAEARGRRVRPVRRRQLRLDRRGGADRADGRRPGQQGAVGRRAGDRLRPLEGPPADTESTRWKPALKRQARRRGREPSASAAAAGARRRSAPRCSSPPRSRS